jgi:hypothetical protein
MRTTGSKRWSADETIIAEQYRAEGRSYTEIGKLMNRERRTVARALNGIVDEPHVLDPADRVEIPTDALSERDYRLSLVPRDLTAWVCGDPLPGYSEADRARNGA